MKSLQLPITNALRIVPSRVSQHKHVSIRIAKAVKIKCGVACLGEGRMST